MRAGEVLSVGKNKPDHLRFTVPSHTQYLEQDLVQELTHRSKGNNHSTLHFFKSIGQISPNCQIVLRIHLTIRITVASGERSFSKLKEIKNYLHALMSQDRLCGLIIPSIGKVVASKMHYTDLTAAKKARKVTPN